MTRILTLLVFALFPAGGCVSIGSGTRSNPAPRDSLIGADVRILDTETIPAVA